MSRIVPRAIAPAVSLLLVLPPLLGAQERVVPLTLDDAVAEAVARNPAHAIASHQAAIARADARATGARVLPALDLGAGFARSDDPVFAFGTRLRQERFTAADFELDALNRPDPISDWSLDALVRWNVVDPSAWAARGAARAGADAAAWDQAWSRHRTVFVTRALYYAAAGAGAALEAAEAEETAARSSLETFRLRAERGLLTRADVLQAEANLRRAEATRIGAARDVERAREDLALHLGWDVDASPEPTDELTAVPPAGRDAPPATEDRADVRALAAAADAAASDATRADLRWLPRIEAFGGWSGHAADAFEVDGASWSVGLALRWNAFGGFERSADRDRAAERREIARIRHAEAVRSARAEIRQAERDVGSSWSALAASTAAARASDEARILMRRRFEEGLATASEHLQAEAGAAAARAAEIAALVGYNVARARLDLASSTPPMETP